MVRVQRGRAFSRKLTIGRPNMAPRIHGNDVEQFPNPPPVKQIMQPYTCWAAALSSWLQIVRPGPPIVAMGNKPTYSGGLQQQMEDYYTTVYDQMWLFQYFKMAGCCTDSGLYPNLVYKVLADPMVRASYEQKSKSELQDGDYFREKLRLSPLWFASSMNGVGHAVVIFAIKQSKNGVVLGMMDPIFGKVLAMMLDDFLSTRVQGGTHIGYVDYLHQVDGHSPLFD
jgi:hypothetical protein